MKQNYNAALEYVLLDEGGSKYTNHPADPGGPTKFGITIHDYRRYVKANATAADVKNMKLAEAKAIYRAKYWDIQHCDLMPSGVDYAMFDYGVNSGIGRSQKVIQRILGTKVDGIIGAKTLAAINAQDPQYLILALCKERLGFLHRLKTWPVFGKGWGRRVKNVQDRALKMLRGADIKAVLRNTI